VKERNLKLAGLALAGLLMAAPVLHAADEATTTSTDDSIEELRAQMGAMSSQLNMLKDKADNGFNFAVNVDLRYDIQSYKTFTYNPTNSPLGTTTRVTAANGGIGMYAKRAEFEVYQKVTPNQTWYFQWDFAALKLEDVGVALNNLPILPFLDKTPTFDMKIGQFRQPFGIEAQTGSSAIAFSERPMFNGGANPFGFSQKLVTERVMGLHFTQQDTFGPLGLKLQFALANDVNDQVAAANGSTLAAAFPTQNVDNDPSEFGRVGLDLNFVPGLSKFNIGASAIHDPENTVMYASLPGTVKWADVYGVDATIETLGFWHLQGEWVARNADAYVTTANPAVPAYSLTRSEGWYVTSVMEPLKLFMKDPTKLEFNMRYDNYISNVDALGAGAAISANVGAGEAITTGLKWSFIGKNYTSVNYTVYGLNGDFGASGPAAANLWVLQQQFNF
jgi:phosphate-selective porin